VIDPGGAPSHFWFIFNQVMCYHRCAVKKDDCSIRRVVGMPLKCRAAYVYPVGSRMSITGWCGMLKKGAMALRPLEGSPKKVD
jgi:hypothetical protein